MQNQYLVAVVGAGPAGLFGARELARSGAHVVMFNRDIKPGGLAEYGIYFNKHTMKAGLRKQFRGALDQAGLDYYGNVTVGAQGDLSLDDLRAMGFQAILVTAGAQGTKWLGLPGEHLNGVYHAKDVVYFYNKLPPFAQMPLRFGRRVAVVGAGNVMVDISRYLLREQNVDEVIAVVRRGPAEVKFDKKEMESIVAYLDPSALDEEMARCAPIMQVVGQDPAKARETILVSLPKAEPKTSKGRFRFEFLASPTQMIGDANNNVTRIEIEENSLALKDGATKARGTGVKRALDVDTVIFAIGDKVDEAFGLPVEWNEFVKNPAPKFAVEGVSFESAVEGIFVGGWSRKASEGLVGYARKDGINASKAVLQYLQTLAPVAPNVEAITAKMKALDKPVVTKEDIQRLEAVEAEEARKRGLDEFKFDNNEDMFAAMGMTVRV